MFPSLQDLSHQERRTLLDRLSERQNHRCCWCHEPFDGHHPDPKSATFEHIQPRTFGGDDRPLNLVVACHECNQKRGGMHYLGFLAWIRASLNWQEDASRVEASADLLETWYVRTWTEAMRERMASRLARLDWLRSIDGLKPIHRLTWIAYLREACFEEAGHDWRDPVHHPILDDPHEILARAAEAQCHRCATCGQPIAGDLRRPGGAFAIVIDRTLRWADRLYDNVVAGCQDCFSIASDRDPLSWVAEQRERTGEEDPRAVYRLRRLEGWLRHAFDAKTKSRIRAEWMADSAERLAQGETPKPWAQFLADFRSACRELGIAA